MSEKKTVIKLNNVSKRFNVYRRNIERIKGVILGREPSEVKRALQSITLEVKEGERLMIVGIADSGRSTLEKLIAGIAFPSKGTIDTFDHSLNVMLDAKAGMDVELSCIDNVYMKANVVGISRAEISKYVDEILEFAEITDSAEIPLKRAPKGTAALLSLAVHLKKDADIVIVDEVFGGGGSYITTKCENRFAEYLAERPEMTAVIVPTRLAYAKTVGTRAIVLDKGKMTYDGDVIEATRIFSEINSRTKR